MLRKLINLVEALQYPDTVVSDYLIDMVHNIHHTPEDFSEGDIVHRISKFHTYVLMEIPINKTNPDEWYYDPDRVKNYIKMNTNAPPIIFDGDRNSIIDGAHRANAALARGETTIMAYVGLPENIDPDWDEEMSEYGGDDW